MGILKLGPLHSRTTQSLERGNGSEGVIKRGREEESRKMIITMVSQQYGTAEAEIMMEGKTQRKVERKWGVMKVNASHIEKTQR